MRILIQKYKKRERKINHIKFLENRITLLHNEIVNDAIYKKVNYNRSIPPINLYRKHCCYVLLKS